MLRTNLSTRPFYNERAVHGVAAAVAGVVLTVTAWQILRVVDLSRQKTELNVAIQRDTNLTNAMTREADQIRQGLNRAELAAVAAAAKEANELIEQRTFSWTALFNQLEATLPDDVMLTSVDPSFKDGETLISLDLQGRQFGDIDQFWDRLEKTGSFHKIEWSAVSDSEGGLQRMQMTAVYTPPQASARPASVTPIPVAPAAKGSSR